MNRKCKEKQSDTNDQFKGIEPIIPKFTANWSKTLHFDRIIVNLAVVQKATKQLCWRVQKDANNAEWDIWWTDWAVSAEVLMKMQQHQKINHFPGMYCLSKKNFLAKNLMKMRKKFPDQYGFFPLTWNLPIDLNEFKNYHETKPKNKARTYIVKPQSQSQGKGIFLTRKLQDINLNQHCVIQRYLSKPYLIDGLKFDLRIYVLVTSVDPIRIFIYKQGLARFATQAYVSPNRQNMDEICMHLTNYAINKDNEKFIFNSDENNMGIGHKKSLQSVYEILQQKGENIIKLKKQINNIIIKTIISGNSFLKFQYNSCQRDNLRSDMCFEILGFDILLTENLTPYLLEINYTPSFSIDTPLDLKIKKGLIKDTLSLLEVTLGRKQAIVKATRENQNNRMMTGKNYKLSGQEKKNIKRQEIDERDKYMRNNLGDFSVIFPDIDNAQQMQIYCNLIEVETETNRIYKKQNIISDLDTSKQLKLPLMIKKEQGESLREKIKKIPRINQKVIMNNRIEKIRSNQQSEKIIKKIKLTEFMIKKKILSRNTLKPKTINFQGGMYDGINKELLHCIINKQQQQQQ